VPYLRTNLSFWNILAIAICADRIERQQIQTNRHLWAIRNQAWLNELESRKQHLQWELNEGFRRRYGVPREEYYERCHGFPSEVTIQLDRLAKLNEVARGATCRPTQPMFLKDSTWERRPVLTVTFVVLGLVLLGIVIAAMANAHVGPNPKGSHFRSPRREPGSHRPKPYRRGRGLRRCLSFRLRRSPIWQENPFSAKSHMFTGAGMAPASRSAGDTEPRSSRRGSAAIGQRS